MASDTPHNGSVDRRSFLAASAAGAMVAATAPQALATALSTPLRVGSELGAGWAIASIGAVEAGAIRVVTSHPATSRAAAVAVCKAEAGSGAMASTGELGEELERERLSPRARRVAVAVGQGARSAGEQHVHVGAKERGVQWRWP